MREVRYSKHQLNYWMNGDEHWLLSGQHYEAHEAPEDIVKKLRNAAWYRGITVDIRIYPDRIFIRANETAPGARKPSTRFRPMEMRLDELEKQVAALAARIQELED